MYRQFHHPWDKAMAAFSQCSICFMAVKLAGYLSPTNDSDWWVMRCFHFRKRYEIRLFITALKYWGKIY